MLAFAVAFLAVIPQRSEGICFSNHQLRHLDRSAPRVSRTVVCSAWASHYELPNMCPHVTELAFINGAPQRALIPDCAPHPDSFVSHQQVAIKVVLNGLNDIYGHRSLDVSLSSGFYPLGMNELYFFGLRPMKFGKFFDHWQKTKVEVGVQNHGRRVAVVSKSEVEVLGRFISQTRDYWFDKQPRSFTSHNSLSIQQRSVGRLLSFRESLAHQVRLLQVDDNLPNNSEKLKKGTNGNHARQSNSPDIEVILFPHFGGFIGGLGSALFGVCLYNERRILGASLIGIGCLCGVSANIYFLVSLYRC